MATAGRTQKVAAQKKLEEVADVIMHAVFNGDEATVKRYGISRRTVQRYRERSLKEAALARIVAYKLNQMEGASLPDELETTISEALATVKRLAKEVKPNAESILAFSQLLQVVMGYDLNRKMLHARLGILNGISGD